jgi:SAM-dependent methyltransferase
MTEPEQLTPAAWIERLAPFDRWNERHIMAAFAVFGLPTSMLDLGCGTGAMVNLAAKLGVDAYGVDLIPRDDSHFGLADLNHPLILSRVYQMVLSLETIEHLQTGIHLLDAIALHVAPHGLVIFSAAGPGQGGDGHDLIRPGYVWRTALANRGLSYRRDWTHMLQLAWQIVPSPLQWLPANVQVFER